MENSSQNSSKDSVEDLKDLFNSKKTDSLKIIPGGDSEYDGIYNSERRDSVNVKEHYFISNCARNNTLSSIDVINSQ